MAKKDDLSEEFFVGYLTDVPAHTEGFLKKIVFYLSMIVGVLAVVLAINQRPFSSANFDYGIYTTHEGDLFLEPFPRLRIASGSKAESYLLVGAGKMGADFALARFSIKLDSLSGSHVKLKGQLIRGNGKQLLQISANELPVLLTKSNEQATSALIDQEISTIEGEVIDPKCFFGVMKPGVGKPHRSCAIRCISGGIPAMFHTANENYILLDENSKPVNQEVVGLVGDVVVLKGRVHTIDDWKVLMMEKNQLKAQVKVMQQNRTFTMMQENITLCAMQ